MTRITRFRSNLFSAAAIGCLAAGGFASPLAHAQDAADEAAETGSAIVVTGSRLVRRDYQSTSPIVTVGEEFLDAQAGSTIAIKLQQMPQFTPGANELTGSGQPTGRATVDLRGLGANRTLVLADGRRLQPSTSQVVIDLNTIPSALVENVEVITGGASAVYGSDAVAGVVNLKLRNDFEGLELSGQYNITELGDGQEFLVEGLFGADIGDRGNVVFGASYLDRGLARFDNRRFYRNAFALGAPPWGSDLLPEGNFIPDAGNAPAQAVVDAVFAQYGVAAGSVAASNVLSFNANNSLFSQFGGFNYQGALNHQYVLSPFSNAIAFNLGTLQYLTAPTERISVFGKGEYEIADGIELYGQAIFTTYNSVTNYGAGLQTQGTTAVVPVDNAFIPADLATLLASRPDATAPFSMRKLWLQTGTSVTEYDNQVLQVLGGLRGSFGSSGNWRWDVYGSHGETAIRQTNTSGGASFSRIQSLLTSRSVADINGQLTNIPAYIPSGNGSNSFIPNPAYATAVNDGGRSFLGPDGLAPCPNGLNIFSSAPLDPSCADFLQIHPTRVTDLAQDVIEGTVQGDLFELPAGAVSALVGASWRRNTYDYMPGPGATDLVGSFPAYAVEGRTSSKELFAEAVVPIVRDIPFLQSVELSVAYRYADYNLAKSEHNWKADLNWEVTDFLRLRGGFQRASRAPNVTELFNPAIPAPALLGAEDPCNFDSQVRQGPNGAAIRSLCLAQGVPAAIIDTYKTTFAGVQAVQRGNPGLASETADTYTIGTVIEPRLGGAFDGISLSVDYYNISLKDAISTTSGDIVFQRCFNQTGDNPAFDPANSDCRRIVRNSSFGTPDQVETPFFNLGGVKTSGIDMSLLWRLGLDSVGLTNAGSVTLNSIVNYLLAFDVQSAPGAAFVGYNGTIGYGALGNNGAFPDVKANTSLTWSLDDKTAGLRWYYVGPMNYVGGGGAGTTSYSRFDLFGGFNLTEAISLTAGVTNLFDVQPEVTMGGLPGNTDSGTYDPLGRRYFIAAKARF